MQEDRFHLGVKALIHNHNGKLLLLQKNAKNSQTLKGTLWDLPGGRIQKNESLEEALKREIYEETGLQNMTQIDPFTMVLTDTRIPLEEDSVGLILAVYVCNLLDDNPTVCLSDEHLHYDWFNPSDAAKLLATNHPAELVNKIAQLRCWSKTAYEV